MTRIASARAAGADRHRRRPEPGRGASARRASGLVQMQRLAGNGAVNELLVMRTVVVQRQPLGPRTTGHPESFASYEEWLATFGSLPHFRADDTTGTTVPTSFEVLGDKPAEKDPKKAKPDDRPVETTEPHAGDKFINHPTDKWVRENLPEELRLTAYRLPSDCADVAVILRHVWLFSHKRSENYGGFVVGFIAGESEKTRSARVRADMRGINTPNVAGMVNAYADGTGAPLRSIAALGPLLHPGDILVWAHHEGPAGSTGDPTRPRSGGHTHTIVSITRSGGTVTFVKVLQGNQPLPKVSGEDLRFAPGRRIEVSGVVPRDVSIPPPKGSKKSPEPVWTWGDGHTTLVAAGPPRSADRPPAHKEHGTTVRHIADWLPAIATASRGTIEGRFEAAMREALAMLEGGAAPATVEGEARSVGRAARQRLDALDALLASAKKPPDPTARDGIRAMLKVLQAGTTSTKPAAAKQVFTAVSGAFEGTVAQAGWSDAGIGGVNAGERMVGGMRRIPLEGLPGGAPQAIVVLPAGVTGGKAPLDVLLHFHGQNEGNRAGRDITVDRVEEQLEATGRRAIAILPQGTTRAIFAPFDADTYINSVNAKLTTMRVWPSAPPRGKVVISGHSGGGRGATEMITGIAGAPPLGMAEVALFDGITGPMELDGVTRWVDDQLDAALTKLRAPGVAGKAGKEDAILRDVPRLRAYHSGSASAKPSRGVMDYPGLHASLRKSIADWFADHGSEMSPRAAGLLRDRFQVLATGSKHDLVVGGPSTTGAKTGALEDALRSL